ncbi:MAG: trigger factor [Lysobacterales bacterium CG02_land_8_20_14_3_00_62_12]|nr:MAG: trigger factor [Xanthomonadales bacterium CG02_land_8_20_14_3_00_62_12]
MQVSVEKMAGLERRIVIHVPTSRIEDKVRDRLRELAHTVRIKGFRPGKVPGKVVEQRFGQQVRSEAMNDVVTQSFEQAVGENNLRPATAPSIRHDGQSADQELVFSATFEVTPEIGTIDVSQMELTRKVSAVTASDVDRMIETLRQQRKRWVGVERNAVIGDMLVFEFSADADGLRFPAEGMERAGTIAGSGALPAAFEAALVDVGTGTEKTFRAEFPADFREPTLAGKSADVTLRVIRVQAGELPAIDDDFAASFGVTSGGVERFREDVRANLEREMRSALSSRNKLHVVDQLVKAYSDFELPKGLIEAEAAALLRQAEEQAQQSGRTGQTSHLTDQFREIAASRVRASLLLVELARQTSLRVDSKRVSEMLATIASTYEEPAKVIELYTHDAKLMGGLRNRVIEDQVIDWVFAAAKVTDQPLDFQQLMQA